MGLIKRMSNLNLENDLVRQLIFGGIFIWFVVLSTVLSPNMYNLAYRKNSQINIQSTD